MKQQNDNHGGIGGRRLRTNSHQQQRWAERCHRSQLTPREFAARHGLSLANLQRWRRRYPAPTPEPRLLEVPFPLALSEPLPWEAEVALAGAITLRLRGALAREVVARLVTAPL